MVIPGFDAATGGNSSRVDDLGGDPACWLDRVCDACGAVVEDGPGGRCPRCGSGRFAPMIGRDEGLERLEALGAPEHHLAVSVTTRRDGSPQVALVNFGVVPDPASGQPRVAFVSRPGAKLANLRRRPHATLVVRSGWEWMAVSGAATLAGPDDPLPGLDDEGLRVLLRDIFAAAGGQHPDLDEYDAVMRAERRCAVLVAPERFVTNPTGSEHREPGEA